LDHEYWRDKWTRGDIGFHEGSVNRLLAHHADRLPDNGRVFLPLCGKTADIGWLRTRGHRVVGAELNEAAVQEVFVELDLTPSITPAGPLTRYAAEGIELVTGDLFDLTVDMIGEVIAVYDRAALVAMPPDTQPHYAAHVAALGGSAPHLMITFVYPAGLIDGPPFSTPTDRVRTLYAGTHRTELLEERPMPNGLKGRQPVMEVIHWLTPV